MALRDEEELQAIYVGPPLQRHDGPIALAEPDALWPDAYAREEARIRGALGDVALLVEHVGSTSVPGLPAKPILDILLVVPDAADESRYVPALEGAGYVLRIREPDWHQHRLFKRSDVELNLHVFPHGSTEIERMRRFRDHLRAHEADRTLYANAKRELASRTWRYVQDYADAKSEVVEAILARALGSEGFR